MPASTNDIVSQMRQLLSISEPELDTTIGSTVRKILDAVGEVVAEGYADKYLLDYQYDIETKFGTDLDDFVTLFGFTRLPAKRATGTITFARSAITTQSVIVPYGTQISTAFGIIFSTIVPGVIVVGQATIEIPVQAGIGGINGNVSAHTVSRRVTPIEGVTSFDNPLAMIGGTDAESDEELRHRFKRTIFRNLAGTEQMFLATALEHPSVSQANVIGASKRHREQLQIIAQTATSIISDAKYIYPDTSVLGASIDGGNILTPGVHYTFNDTHPNLGTPSAPTLGTVATGGSLVPGTYNYKVSAINEIGQTLASATATIVVPGGTNTNTVTLTWAAVPGATGYRVYGRTNASMLLFSIVNAGPYTDTGAVVGSVVPPTVYSAGYSPVITILDAATAPDGIYDLEFEYVPVASRNDPAAGITNRIDVYVNGTVATAASEMVVFRSSRVFSLVDGDPLNVDNFRRNTEAKPASGNYFVQFAFTPVLDPAITNQIVIGGITYIENTDFYLINDVSRNGGAPHTFSGLEWISVANGATKPIPTNLTTFAVAYTFNVVPQQVETSVRAWRLVTTDVKAHYARPILLNLNLAVILLPGYSTAGVQPSMQAALSSYLNGVGFNGVVQVSDLLEVAHSVRGVDAVRFLTSADDGTVYAIQQVNNVGGILKTYATTTGAPFRAIDVIIGDDRVAALNTVTLLAKAQNAWGAV